MPPLAEGSVPEDAPRRAGEAATGDALGPEASRPELEVVDTDAPRRHPSTIGGAFYLGILAATVVGLVVVSVGRWRAGVHVMAGALIVAALLRAVLPVRDAGMLAVRQRWFDAALLAATGVALWLLATTIPEAG